ncbi:hypothetical protein LZ30DRAFT_581450 [Colletotrichum cereale]|nr:hypothetical protein LZ30DRAFT_581450 [Colletotrichum cereale]
MRGLGSLVPSRLRNTWHDLNVLGFALVCIGIFEHFFFSDAFLKTRFLIWVAKNTSVKNPWVFGALAWMMLAGREFGVKLALAALQSSVDLAIELALVFLVFPLHFWRSPERPLPDDRYIVAWGVLASAASTAVGALDDYHGSPWWHDLARVNPALLCRSAAPFSLYTTCSHYAALILLLAEVEHAFCYRQCAVEAEGSNAPEAELTARKIWVYRVRFLVWSLLMRLSISMAFELVSDASGSLQCWYVQQGMKFLDFLPRALRRVPFRVCVLGFHYLVRSWCFSWMVDLVDRWVNPENHQDDDDDDDDHEEDRDWDDEDGGDVGRFAPRFLAVYANRAIWVIFITHKILLVLLFVVLLDLIILLVLFILPILAVLVITVALVDGCCDAVRDAFLDGARGAGERGDGGGGGGVRA